MMEATWLFSSAKKGEYESILSAMQAGVDPDLTDEAGKTLAHMAAAAGHTKVSVSCCGLFAWRGVGHWG